MPHGVSEEGKGRPASLSDARGDWTRALRYAALQVRQRPDGNYDLRIRGAHTIMESASEAEPLLVIDDVPIPKGSIGNTLGGLAPRDVARIDVLKDAAATGPYGSRGANGVIIITTKRAPRPNPSP